MRRALRIIRHELAISDLDGHAEYLRTQSSLETALRFLEAAEATFSDLAAMPGMGKVREVRNPRLSGLRQWRVVGFEKYLIFYRVSEEALEVLRVLYGTRDLDRILEEDEEG